jgi:acyl-CoA thioesterase YciA
VSLFAEIISTGRTSIKISVEAWRRARDGDVADKVTQGIFTFVALTDDRRPRELPPV